MVAEETGMAFLSVSAAEIVTKCSGREKVEKMPDYDWRILGAGKETRLRRDCKVAHLSEL